MSERSERVAGERAPASRTQMGSGGAAPGEEMSEQSNQVEHTFVVAVPVERAWEAFTDSHERSQWEAPTYEIDPQPGGKLRWRIPPWDTVEGEVLEVDTNRKLVMAEGEGVLDGTTRVTVTFESADEGTRITVVQAGFGDGARWRDQLEGHRHGWLRAIRDLALYLETGISSQRFFTTWRCDLGMSTAETLPGLKVTEVTPGGFAADAGLEAGDVLLYIDGMPIFERTDLWGFQISREPGDRLDVEAVRGGARVRGSGQLRAISTAA